MRRAILLIACLSMLVAPGAASAATVVNGDFESGNLRGWHVHESGFGNWFAYKGIEAPIGHQRGADPVQAPPQGDYAAIADQADPDTLILYQDIALEPGAGYRLSLLAYYDSYEPIAVPTPDTLSVDDAVLGGQNNQQYRIDVMKSDAPLESLAPADILRTLFRTKPGDPLRMQPTRLTADLSPFAGQTVRLRIASAVHEEVLNAGVDAVSLSLSSSSPGHSPTHGSSRFSLGKAEANRRNGTAILSVRVPGPGTLKAQGKGIVPPATIKVADAGTVGIRLKPTRSSRAILKRKHKLRVSVTVIYTPTGDSRETAATPVMLRLKPRSRGGH